MSNFNEPRASEKTHWLAMALTLATFALFAPALRYDYVDYDDGVYVYGNQAVLKGWTWEGVRYAFTSVAGSSWMPMTWLSYQTDIELLGPSPGGLHATNILLHALSAGILFLALQRMTGRVWPSVLVATLFAFHPLRNESVVWIAERKDVLSTFFWMLGLLAYARYVEKPEAKRYAMVAVCLLVGLMAKPSLVTFPFALLLLDFWPLKRLGEDWRSFRGCLWTRVREKLPMFAMVLVISAATYWTQYNSGAVSREEAPVGGRLLQVTSNYGFYLQKIFLPTDLSIIHPPQTLSASAVAVASLLLVLVTALVLWQLFRQPWLAVGWFWFLGTLVPVVGIVRIGHVWVAERYTYLPSVGLAVAIAWGMAELIRWRPRCRPFVISLEVLLVLTCALVTRADLPRWKDSVALFESAIRVAPHAISYNNIAVYYLDRREYERAIEPLSRAIELDPNHVKAILNRITAYEKTGRDAEALADHARLVKLEPKNAEGYTARAEVLMKLGRLDEAIADFTSAITLRTNHAVTYNNRATVLLLKGEFTAALEDAHKALELDPRYSAGHVTLGNIYHRMGNLPGALEQYTKAIEMTPRDALYYNNRAAVLFAMKEYDKAREDLRRCQSLGGHPHEGLVKLLTEVEGR